MFDKVFGSWNNLLCYVLCQLCIGFVVSIEKEKNQCIFKNADFHSRFAIFNWEKSHLHMLFIHNNSVIFKENVHIFRNINEKE